MKNTYSYHALMKRSLLIILFFVLWCIPSHSQQKEITIVTFGNSTTARRKGVTKVYAQSVHEKLDSLGIPNDVINAGVGSSHTGSIKDNDFAKVVHAMDRFDTSVLRHRPDWVTLNFGLNDAYQDKGIGASSRIPVKNFRKNIRYYIKKIRKQGGKIILLTPNPLGSKYEPFRHERLKLYADAIRKISKCKRTYLIDSWELFYDWEKGKPTNIDGLFTDGIHPNDEGHRLIAEKIVEIISKNYR